MERMEKHSGVDWLYERWLRNPIAPFKKDLYTKAKELEHKQQEELLRWRDTMFTQDAPLEYVLSEFNKLKNK